MMRLSLKPYLTCVLYKRHPILLMSFFNVIYSDFIKQKTKRSIIDLFGFMFSIKSEKMTLIKLGVSCREQMLTHTDGGLDIHKSFFFFLFFSLVRLHWFNSQTLPWKYGFVIVIHFKIHGELELGIMSADVQCGTPTENIILAHIEQHQNIHCSATAGPYTTSQDLGQPNTAIRSAT